MYVKKISINSKKINYQFIKFLVIKRRRRELARKARLEGFERRYLQVYAQCYCEINRLSAERKPGRCVNGINKIVIFTYFSCFAAYKGKISLLFATGSQLQNFHPTKCLCQVK